VLIITSQTVINDSSSITNIKPIYLRYKSTTWSWSLTIMVVTYEDYMYTKKASYKTTVRWECSQKCSKQCKGSLTTDTEMARVIRSSAHSNDGSKVTVAAIKVRVTLKDQVSSSRGTLAQLLSNHTATVPIEVRAAIGQRESVKRTVRREKAKSFPADAAPIIFKQLYVIHVSLRESAVSCIYGFLSGKSQNTYEEFLQAILDGCSNLGYQPDPTTIVTDFEQACITVVSTALGPHAPGVLLSPNSKYFAEDSGTWNSYSVLLRGRCEALLWNVRWPYLSAHV